MKTAWTKAIAGLFALAAAAMVLSSGRASAQEPQHASSALAVHLANSSVADLEDLFWICDYMATTRGADDITLCRAAYDALKQRKFAGDFDKLLLWWQQHKFAQHAKLDGLDCVLEAQ
jgi:hypothetical protein